jgi:flagellar basal-body rod protein FlgC
MISSLTSLSGMAAATDRLEAIASNVANKDSGGGLPKAGAPIGQEAYKPIRVEQSSQGETGGTYTTMRSTTPAYLAVYDPQDSNADGNGMVAKPNVDLVQEMTGLVEAEASFKVNAKTLEAQNELVKKLYDLV